MGLAKRIIPTLLCRGDTLVKGKRFDSWRSVGHVLQAARIYASRDVDELIILDITATPEGRGPNLKLVEKLTDGNFSPVTVGGGVRSMQDVRDLFCAGADKVAIGTRRDLIKEVAGKFGRQAIVFALDCRDGNAWTHCGTRDSGEWVERAARTAEEDGAGEILVTSIAREGTMEGYELGLVGAVANVVNVPVIAHGGCGTPRHALEAIQAGASAVAIGAMFQFSDETPKSVCRFLRANGVEVRL